MRTKNRLVNRSALFVFAALQPCTIVGCEFLENDASLEEFGEDSSRREGNGNAYMTSYCGNLIVEGAEVCDDGNLDDDDGCNNTCQPSEVASIALGDGTTCIVTSTGRGKCWGRSEYGQGGQGDQLTRGDDETPASFPYIELGGLALSMATNGEQVVVLMDDFTVRSFGRNDSYQLGLGHNMSIGDDESPVSAVMQIDPQVGGPVAQIAVGGDFTCVRMMTGDVRCWGANEVGQLGQGHTDPLGGDDLLAGIPPIALIGSSVNITAGAQHACAVLEGGKVQCWGLGQDGQLGYGSPDNVGDDESPSQVGSVDLAGVAVEVVAGAYHTCARLESGAARCWGRSDSGQLGYGDTQGGLLPPSALGDIPIDGVVEQLGAGWDHTCAVLDSGLVYCWGSNSYNQLGPGYVENASDNGTPIVAGPMDLGNLSARSVHLGSMSRSTCVLLDDGALRCYGEDDKGQLGYGGRDVPDVIVFDDDDGG